MHQVIRYIHAESYFRWLSTMLLAALLTACANSPLSVAETPEQKAFALFGTFVALEETAADVIEDPAISSVIKERIRLADANAKPVVDGLYEAAALARRIRAEVAAGETSQARLNSALANLDNWINQAVPLVEALRVALQR